jgi:hypothetical protein
MSIKNIARALELSRERVGCIIYKILENKTLHQIGSKMTWYCPERD